MGKMAGYLFNQYNLVTTGSTGKLLKKERVHLGCFSCRAHSKTRFAPCSASIILTSRIGPFQGSKIISKLFKQSFKFHTIIFLLPRKTFSCAASILSVIALPDAIRTVTHHSQSFGLIATQITLCLRSPANGALLVVGAFRTGGVIQERGCGYLAICCVREMTMSETMCVYH